MLYQALADTVVLAHVAFVVFIIFGGLLVLRWRRLAWAHVPAAMWGVAIEWLGWECPLTPLENWLWAQGGERGYAGGFVEHYVVPLLYPASLTRELQLALGAFVLVINLAIYWLVIRRGAVHVARRD